MSVVNSTLNRLSYLSNGPTATAAAVVVILLLVLVVVLVLGYVSNILVKNFRFSRTSTSTSTKIIRLDHMHTPYAFSYFFSASLAAA
jgi:Tfp pilus assembly protein PilO